MPTTYTGVTQSTDVSNAVISAYDLYFDWALRSKPSFRQYATKRAVDIRQPGQSVVFNLYSDMALVSTALTQNVDPDAVALGNTSQVTVTLNEWGNVGMVTRRLELTALSDVDKYLAMSIANNMVDSLDYEVQRKVAGPASVYTANGSGVISALAAAATASGTGISASGVSGVAGTYLITSNLIRNAVTKLRAGNVVPTRGDLYTAVIHPNVSFDLRRETGTGGWRTPHEYQAADELWAGEVGIWEGAAIVENPRCFNGADGASSAVVYNSYILGSEFIAEAVWEEPHMVIGEIVDKLRRFRPVGWYGVLGWAKYRTTAAIGLVTSSTAV